MKLFGREMSGFAKVLVVLAAVLLVSSGLCGITVSLAGNGGWYNLPNTPWGNFLGFAGMVEMIAMVISGPGMVLVAIAWLVSAVYDSFVNTPKDGVQKLFDNEDKPKDR
jgi:hypothetical protein